MSKNIEITEVEGQMDLLTGETVEIVEELSVEEIVTELVGSLEESVTAYKIHNVVNGTFQVLGNEKRVPPQMMYNYTRNGMIVKGKKGSAKEIRYSHQEVIEFAVRYVNKHI